MKKFKNYRKALLIAAALCITGTISTGSLTRVNADTYDAVSLSESADVETAGPMLNKGEVETDRDGDDNSEPETSDEVKNVPKSEFGEETSANEERASFSPAEISKGDTAVSSSELSPETSSEASEEKYGNEEVSEESDEESLQDEESGQSDAKESSVSESGNGASSNVEKEEKEEKDENLETGFFHDGEGHTKYRDPETKEVFQGGILALEEDGEDSKYVFDSNGNLVMGAFVKLKDGSTVYAKNDGKLLEQVGLIFIGGERYVFKDDHTVLIDGWYKLNNGKTVYASPAGGKLYKNGAFTLKNGSRYVFNADGYLAEGEWVEEPGYGMAYGRPYDGVAYSQGAYTLADGKRYVFDKYGYLLKGGWVNEPGYGRAYGRPDDGVAYSKGAYTLADGKRYVFNEYGYLAKGAWVDEPGYGRAYGRPEDGVAYSLGAYTVNDGKKYVFNRYGYLAKGAWVDEPGYGRAYGRPEDGVAYSQGAYTVNDGKRYVFNKSGYLAKGAWVDEPGYGRTYGDPNTGLAYIHGAFTISYPYLFDEYGYLTSGWLYEEGYGWSYGISDGTVFFNEAYDIDNELYVFGKSGHLAVGWVKDRHSGRMLYGTDVPMSPNNRNRGVAYANKSYYLEGEWKPFDLNGYYYPRSWGRADGSISEQGYKNFIRINIYEQLIYCVRNGKIVMAAPMTSGDVQRYMETPKGRFSILYKARNAVLSGPGYSSVVKYWVPFTYQGHGIHDANGWRLKYGGDLYLKNSGSHGCVNVPTSAMDVMYDYMYVGMPIFIY